MTDESTPMPIDVEQEAFMPADPIERKRIGTYRVGFIFPAYEDEEPSADPGGMTVVSECIASAMEGVMTVLEQEDGIESGPMGVDYIPLATVDAPLQRPAHWLIDSGLLWLINASVFHPRGLALTVDPTTNGMGLIAAAPGEAMSYLAMSTTNPNGVDIDAKYRAAEQTMAEARVGQYGDVYDPMPSVDETDHPTPEHTAWIDAGGGAVTGRVYRDGAWHERPLLRCQADLPHTVHSWWIRAHGPECVCDGDGRAGDHDDLVSSMLRIEEDWEYGKWSTGRPPAPRKVQMMIEVGDVLDKISYVLGQGDVVTDRNGTPWTIAREGAMAESKTKGAGGVQSIGIFTLEANHGPFTVVALAEPRERK